MLRPKRRASQTYFFKYQLARNPLKAEEEDLKYAIMASLQQCNNSNSRKGSTKKSRAISGGSSSSSISSPISTTAKSTPQHNSVPLDNNNYQHQQPATAEKPSDDDYSKNRHKPETEDFLTFICYRNIPILSAAEQRVEALHGKSTATATTTSNNNNTNNNTITGTATNSNGNSNLNSTTSNHHQTSTNGDCSSPIRTNHHHRAPIRQSPRLANSQSRKISENESNNSSSNLFSSASSSMNYNKNTTAYDNSITYEEDMERASIALEDMAHEIHSSDGIKDEFAQESSGCISSSSSAAGTASSNNNNNNNNNNTKPYKNNKHLVKGLMTREFAGAFADEDTIFESISNHKL